MPTLFIMSGYPFAGKSTLARQLVEQFGLVRVSLDEINGELGIGSDPGIPITPDQWDRSYAEFHARIEHLLAGGRSVIADVAGFSRRDARTCEPLPRPPGHQPS